MLKSFFFVVLLPMALCMNGCKAAPDTGTIKGTVILPAAIDRAAAAKEARLFVYLRDCTPKHGKEVSPRQTPVVRTVASGIRGLTSAQAPFTFKDVPAGTYAVCVLIDTGRPHVREGSSDLVACPGDYTGGTAENVTVTKGAVIDVSVQQGIYVTIPEGYEVPVHTTD